MNKRLNQQAQSAVVMMLLFLATMALSWFSFRTVQGHGKQQPETPAPERTGDKYTDDIKHLTWLLKENWSWLEMRQSSGLDLEVLEREAINSLNDGSIDKDFLHVVTRYLAAIQDGHSHVSLNGVDSKDARRWPISLVESKEGIMVDGTDPIVFRANSLRQGDLVLEVNGKSIESLIGEQEKFVFASTPLARRCNAIVNVTESTTLTELNLKVLRLGKPSPEAVSVKCPLKDGLVARYSWLRKHDYSTRVINSETAYLRPGSFLSRDTKWSKTPDSGRDEILESQYKEYHDFFRSIEKKKNLILDLRGNPGGTDLLGEALCLHLLEPGFRFYRLGSKTNGTWRFSKWTTVNDTGYGKPRFKGKLVCFIDEETFSTADNVASCLRDNHPEIFFIGQNTGGGSGAPRFFTLPSTGIQVRFCTMRVVAPNGEPIEGNGVKPDALHRPSCAERVSDKDGAIDLALDYFEREAK